jgi:tetratricopeptide (TPR) repeat protein
MAITLAVFSQTLRHQFVDIDDGPYVYENPVVTNGLTQAGITQAFTHASAGTWDPLTTLSHMFDCQVYGLQPGDHHLTNVLLHTASAILLFLLLRKMTGALWKSAFVAAIFAIHPLHVESVAWVSERKDTLSGLFFMLTLWAYVYYANGPPRLSRYLLVVLCFVLGLMSKAMLVTLPLVLLLLDYWPLKRFEGLKVENTGWPARLRNRVILEKIPLVALSAGSCFAAVLAQKQGNAVQSLDTYPLMMRLGNAVISLVTYVWQMFYPVGLAVFYPYPLHGPAVLTVVLAVGLLAAISAVAWHWRRTRPYLLAGWVWYLVMLLPVIGLIQLGRQAHADRYTYLPQVGLYVAMTWLAGSLGSGWRRRGLVLGAAAGLIVAALSAYAFIQTSYWQDSESLWEHAIACTTNNAVAHYGLAMGLIEKGREDDATAEFQRAVEADPNYILARFNLGTALARRGRLDEAMAQFQRAIETRSDFAPAHGMLGILLLEKGRVEEAIAELRQVLKIEPENWQVRDRLGTVLFQRGQVDEAITQFQAMLASPSGDARAQARENLRTIAWVLATSPDAARRNGVKALELAQELSGASGNDDPGQLVTLAAAYAEVGRFPDAIATTDRALQLSAVQTNASLTGLLNAQINLYQSGQPFRDTSQTKAQGQP